MPEISRFYGIIVFMNYREHDPPHFHANYQEQQISIEIKTGMVEGRMARRALRMLFEWLELHEKDLLEDWELAKARKPLKKIDPLP